MASSLFPILLVLLAALQIIYGKFIKVDPSSHLFVDHLGRNRIFHGVNAVYKIAPWVPSTVGFDPENSLSSTDAKNLKSWGFNVVRLGVMWPGLEPGARGQYSSTYLDEIQTIVELLAKEDIFVVLDFHQDLMHRKYCGEGVPDYVYDICKAAQPAGTPAFPLPAVNATYPLDQDGNPTLEACLTSMFATYYMSSEVGALFQCLYDNESNLWDALAGYWVEVAKRFNSFDNVLGYELINEPWAGNNHETPKELLPHFTEKEYLQPLYQHLHNAIRTVDDQKIIFYEGLTIDYWPNGFTQGPGGPAYNDRQAFAYHIYCPLQNPTVKGEVVCDAINDEFFIMRTKDINRLGGGMIMTEFGAAEDIRGDLYALEKSMQQADKHMQSWMYWQFKYYQDITTCTPEGESLYTKDGTVSEHKIKILSRTYPQAVAGALKSYHFDPLTRKFKMSFTGLPASATTSTTTSATTSATTSTTTSATTSTDDARTSLVYFNREVYYPHGVSVAVTNAADGTALTGDAVTVQCSHFSNLISVVQAAGVSLSAVEVEVTPCIPLVTQQCSCL